MYRREVRRIVYPTKVSLRNLEVARAHAATPWRPLRPHMRARCMRGVLCLRITRKQSRLAIAVIVVRTRTAQLRITRITDDQGAIASRNVNLSPPYNLHERFVQPHEGGSIDQRGGRERVIDRHGGQGRVIDKF